MAMMVVMSRGTPPIESWEIGKLYVIRFKVGERSTLYCVSYLNRNSTIYHVVTLSQKVEKRKQGWLMSITKDESYLLLYHKLTHKLTLHIIFWTAVIYLQLIEYTIPLKYR